MAWAHEKPKASVATTSSWDGNTEITIEPDCYEIHVSVDTATFIVLDGLTSDPTIDGVPYSPDVPHRKRYEYMSPTNLYLHYKTVTGTGTIKVTSFHK